MAASIAAIAEATLRWPFRLWAFGEAIAADGLQAAADALGRPQYRQHVTALCLASIARRVGVSPDDHPAPARAFLSCYRETGDSRYRDALGRLVEIHEQMPTNPGGALLVRAHLAGWRHQIWADSMDVIGPLFVCFGRASGEDHRYEQAIDLTLAHARLLQRDDGLFFHGFDTHAGANGHLWARGNGWALMGLVETLVGAPPEIPGWQELLQRLQALVRVLTRTQRQTGLWTTVIDRDDSYEETTLAAMFAAAVPRAIKAGLLSTEYGTTTARARAAVLEKVNDDGVLALVSEATPVGQFSTYATRPFGSFPWGQGPLLLMLCNSVETTT